MHILTRVWGMPKLGNSRAEYEDAAWPERGVEVDAEFFQLALADGATETSFSGLWAKLLVHAYCRGEFSAKRFRRTIEKLGRQWRKTVTSVPLPWYAEEKLQTGAYSSLIGLTVHASTAKSEVACWEALAIGDSCLFQIRKEALILKWPMEHSDQFSYHPILLSTEIMPEEETSEQRVSGVWAKGDLFYLMTDALAQWYLRQVEQGYALNAIIPDLGDDDSAQFSDWISGLRESEQLRNDDVTLMRVLLT